MCSVQPETSPLPVRRKQTDFFKTLFPKGFRTGYSRVTGWNSSPQSPAITPTISRLILRDRFQTCKIWAGYGRVLLTFPAIFTTRPPVQLSSGGGRGIDRWHARREKVWPEVLG